jgi:hypothetical protein
MNAIALYTFGLLDPTVGTAEFADFARRGSEIIAASDDAPGFLGRASRDDDGDAALEARGQHPGHVAWGAYVLPDVPAFAGRDRQVHIATLSLWEDVATARRFVYDGLHRDALRLRYDWFLKGTWPGYVLWEVADGVTPTWSDGVARYEALAAEGESPDRFTFASRVQRG